MTRQTDSICGEGRKVGQAMDTKMSKLQVLQVQGKQNPRMNSSCGARGAWGLDLAEALRLAWRSGRRQRGFRNECRKAVGQPGRRMHVPCAKSSGRRCTCPQVQGRGYAVAKLFRRPLLKIMVLVKMHSYLSMPVDHKGDRFVR